MNGLFVFGYEIVGEIVEIGEVVRGFGLGDCVIVFF